MDVNMYNIDALLPSSIYALHRIDIIAFQSSVNSSQRKHIARAPSESIHRSMAISHGSV
jgi:hypothetical protein